MELLRPAGFRVHDGLVIEESAAELGDLLGARGHADEGFLEDQLDLDVAVVLGVESVHAVVGEPAAHRMEEIVALLQGLAEVGVGVDPDAGGLAEPVDIVLVFGGVLDGHGLVGAPGGKDAGPEGVVGDHLVPVQVVGGVVRRADDVDVELADEGLAAEFGRGELGVALLEDLAGRGGRQELVDAEDALQLQMRPVVERVAHRVGHGLRPLLEGLPRAARAARDVFLRYAVAAHRAPFIVVARVAVHQPELGDIAELDVFGNLLRGEMAVVVDDGHLLRMVVVEALRRGGGEHEVVVDE